MDPLNWLAPELTLDGWFSEGLEDAQVDDRTGSVTGSTTSTGTIVGTKYEPDAPAEDFVPGSGGRTIRFEPGKPKPAKPALIRRTGAVRGVAASYGYVTGTRATTGTVTATTPLRASTPRGSKSAAGLVRGTTTIPDRRFRGDAVSMHPHADIRRMRDDADLLLLV